MYIYIYIYFFFSFSLSLSPWYCFVFCLGVPPIKTTKIQPQKVGPLFPNYSHTTPIQESPKLKYGNGTVDGRNPAKHLLHMKSYQTWDILNINWLAGFLPSTVWLQAPSPRPWVVEKFCWGFGHRIGSKAWDFRSFWCWCWRSPGCLWVGVPWMGKTRKTWGGVQKGDNL